MNDNPFFGSDPGYEKIWLDGTFDQIGRGTGGPPVRRFSFDGREFLIAGGASRQQIAMVFYLAIRARMGDRAAAESLDAAGIVLKTQNGESYWPSKMAPRPTGHLIEEGWTDKR